MPAEQSTRTRFARPFGAVALLGATVLAGAGAFGGTPGAGALTQTEPDPDPRPNVVVVMTDDQDAASLRVMNTVREQLATEGVTFERSFATFPLCCPSRATFLTGQYAHNHGVLQSGNQGYGMFDPSTSIAFALDQAGYRTGLVGKYLNGYAESASPDIPPGWDEWHALWGRPPRRMYNYSLNHNGDVAAYGAEPADYQTDVLAGLATEFIHESASLPQPFFLTVFPSAPHGDGGGSPSPAPAPRHSGAFADEPFPEPPSFNERNVSDKPTFVQETPRLGLNAQRTIAGHYRDRLESLLAVDEAVAAMLDALRETAELSTTLVIFTSDNGFLQGEHRLRGKLRLYEESVEVPLVMAGPGIPAGVTRRQLTGNVDLAPTILDAADVQPLATLDGRSLLAPAADGSIPWRSEILLENRRTTAIRTATRMYAEHATGERELYDLVKDPFQLRSRHLDPAMATTMEALSTRLHEIESCQGSTCP